MDVDLDTAQELSVYLAGGCALIYKALFLLQS